MAAPAVQSFTSAIATGTSVSVSYPSGIAAGELLVLLAACDQLTGSQQWASGSNVPSGFTFRNCQARSGAQIGIWWRVADGSESGSVSIPTSVSVNLIGWCLRITGAATSSPISQLGTTYSASSNSHAVTGVTTSQDDSLAMALLSFDGGDAGSFGFSGTGWSKSDEQYSPSTGANDASATWGTKSVATAGATGTVTITTAASDDAVACQFIIAPAPAGVLPRRSRRTARNDLDPSTFRGKTTRGRPRVDDFSQPTWLPVNRHQLPPDPNPDVLRGRTLRRRTIVEDYTPPPFTLLPRPTVPPPVNLDALRGRTRRSRVPAPPAPAPGSVLHKRKNSPPVPPPQILSGRTRRRWHPRLVLFDRELALRFDLDVFADTVFRVVARNIATGAETELGTATPTSTTIAGVALADGQYSLRVEVDGQYWRGARYAQEWPLTIVAGEIVEPLPEVRSLTWQQVGSSIYVSWTYEEQAGTGAPESFGVWTGASSPVSTAGAPEATADSSGPGSYLVTLPASASPFYVAVAARRGVRIGPPATVLVTPDDSIDSPASQSARTPDGGWTQEGDAPQ